MCSKLLFEAAHAALRTSPTLLYGKSLRQQFGARGLFCYRNIVEISDG